MLKGMWMMVGADMVVAHGGCPGGSLWPKATRTVEERWGKSNQGEGHGQREKGEVEKKKP